MLKYFLGIDISKNEFHACLSVIDHAQQVKVKTTRKFSNQSDGFKELQNWIRKNRKEPDIALSIVMEATGVYYEGCALYLFKAGIGFA